MRHISNGIRLAALALFASLTLGPTAQALDSNISASVCNATLDGSAIFITSPLNDSTIGSSALTVKGAVSKISQVELYIDGAYSQTKALPPGVTVYSMPTTVSKGTHTLFVRGSDLCGGVRQSSNVVVTYQTQVAPSDGGSIPTTGGAVVGDSLSSPNQAGDLPELQGLEYIPPLLTDIFRMTDLDTLGNKSLPWVLVHFGLLGSGLIMVFAGPSIYRWLILTLSGEKRSIAPYLLRLTRIIGLGLILTAFLV